MDQFKKLYKPILKTRKPGDKLKHLQQQQKLSKIKKLEDDHENDDWNENIQLPNSSLANHLKTQKESDERPRIPIKINDPSPLPSREDDNESTISLFVSENNQTSESTDHTQTKKSSLSAQSSLDAEKIFEAKLSSSTDEIFIEARQNLLTIDQQLTKLSIDLPELSAILDSQQKMMGRLW